MTRTLVAFALSCIATVATGHPLEAQSTLRARVGEQIVATEVHTDRADTVLATTAVASAGAQIRARAVFGKGRLRTYDMEASVQGTAQRLQLDLQDTLAVLAVQVGDKTRERTLTLTRSAPLLVYQNFVFAPLARQLRGVPLAVGASAAIQVVIIETGALSSWNLSHPTADSFVLTADTGLRMEIELNGERLMSLRVPSQSLIVSGDR